MMNYYIFFLLGVVSAYDIYTDSPCPDLKPVDNFNFTAYASARWYEIARYSNDWVGRGDCVYMDHVNNGNKYSFSISDVIDHKLVSVEGSAERPKDDTKGVLLYVSDFYKASEGTTEFPVNVISIDYDSYCIVHHCVHDSTKKFHHEFIWILSRFQEMKKESQNVIDTFLSTNLIDKRKLIWDHFSAEYCKAD